jgi:YhhN-like protein.
MDLTSAAFVLSILVAATAAVISDFKRQKLLTYFFRPFTVALMMGFLLEVKRASPYRNIVLAALFFCLVGEIAMMLRKKIFQPVWFLSSLATFYSA